jgi:hypothetical protein
MTGGRKQPVLLEQRLIGVLDLNSGSMLRVQREHPKWDVDNISHDKTSRTLINSYTAPAPAAASDEVCRMQTGQDWQDTRRPRRRHSNSRLMSWLGVWV